MKLGNEASSKERRIPQRIRSMESPTPTPITHPWLQLHLYNHLQKKRAKMFYNSLLPRFEAQFQGKGRGLDSEPRKRKA